MLKANLPDGACMDYAAPSIIVINMETESILCFSGGTEQFDPLKPMNLFEDDFDTEELL